MWLLTYSSLVGPDECYLPPVQHSQCLQTRLAYTPEQINDAVYVDINSNKAVFDSLRNNLKVHYDGKRFSYKVSLNLFSCRSSRAHSILFALSHFLYNSFMVNDFLTYCLSAVQAWFEGQESASLLGKEISRGHCCHWS